jgi:hypothetical protein
VIIAHSVETALIMRETQVDATIVVVHDIHHMKHYAGEEKNVVLVFDNKEPKLDKDILKIRLQTQDYLKAQGKEVSILKPQKERDSFSDALEKHGPEKVRAYLNPIRGRQFIEKLDDIKNQLKGRLSPDEREDLQQILKDEMRQLKHDPSLRDHLRSAHPELKQEIDKHATKERGHGMSL